MCIDDRSIERTIAVKGHAAPPVTLDDLTANIEREEIVTFVSAGGKVLRWAVLTTTAGMPCVVAHRRRCRRKTTTLRLALKLR